MTLHTHHFSHEIKAGPSGPARSYWNVRRNGKDVTTLCLHARDSGIDPELSAQSVCYALDQAFNVGAEYRSAEIRKLLGYNR